MLVAVALLAAIVVLVLLERYTLQSRTWLLFRCLFPAYRFFERVEPLPAFHVRYGSYELSPWLPALRPPPRRSHHLLLNAQGNLHLAYCSLIERFLDDLEEVSPERTAELVSYALLRELAAQEVMLRRARAQTSTRDAAPSEVQVSEAEPEACFFQFRLVQRGAIRSELFVSQAHRLASC